MNTYPNEVPVIGKIYGLYKDFYGYSVLFPKKDKYTLGIKIESYMISTLELMLSAQSAQRNEKIVFIRQASVKFDALKIFIRLANELKMISDKRYITLQNQLQEIGRMMGGWQKSLN